jgi:hypothetical protein
MNIASLQNLISNLPQQRVDTERPERGIALAYCRACAGVPEVVRGTDSTDRPTIHEAETKHRTAEATSESVSLLTLSAEVIQSGRVIPIVPNKPLFINTLIIWSSSNYEDQLDIFGQRMASRELKLPSQVRCSSVPGGSCDWVEWLDPTNRVLLSIEHRLITKVLEETAPHNDVELQQSFEMRDRHIAPLILALRADLEDGSPAGHLLRGLPNYDRGSVPAQSAGS